MSRPPPTAWYTAGAPLPEGGCVRALGGREDYNGSGLACFPLLFFFFVKKRVFLTPPTPKFDPKKLLSCDCQGVTMVTG